jgi:hypothetical protein
MKRAFNLPVPVVFSEVKLAPAETVHLNIWAIEIVAPAGMTIHCRVSVH